jgi:arylsulfatase
VRVGRTPDRFREPGPPRAGRWPRRPALLLVGLAIAPLLAACPGAPKQLVYDLARRAPVAERWSAHEVLLFGTPAVEPNLPEGFYREAGAGGEPFLWSKGESEVALRFDQPRPRAVILDLQPFRGVRERRLGVRLNGTPLEEVKLSELRSRYRIALPVTAQKAGENRLRFVFAATAAPSDEDPKAQDSRQLAAAFYSLTLGPADDSALDDLLRREAPRPFAVEDEGGVPSLRLVGPALVRFALRLPAGAELRFTPELLDAARASAGAASFRVTFESGDQPAERDLWSLVLRANDRPPGEVVVRVPGSAGEIVRLGLLVGSVEGSGFAWGAFRAPRILGRGGADPLEPGALPPSDDARADTLRRDLAKANVLFVILDAARAREFGAYGYARPTTPEIDRIAREGVVFEQAFTPAVYTLGAMSSVWTSQYPDRHHGDVSFSSRLPKDRLTLADVLSGQGILTAGFVANAIAGGLNGFDRGFQEFHEVWRELGSRADVFRRALPPWLAKNKERRFFAYVHFREPHFPYDPEPPFDTKFGPDGPIPKAARRDAAFIQDVNQGRRPFSAAEREHLVRLYDGNLAYADQEVGALRRALESEGLWEKTVVVIAADHGEGLLEHGWIGHNVELFEPSAHVPLVIRFPGGVGPRGTRVPALVDLLDVAPTVADVFGVRGKGGADREFRGRSLLPVAVGAGGKPLVLSRTVWDRPRYALRDGRWTYVYETATGREQLFDAKDDPGETKDLAAPEALRTAYYRETLHEWTRSVFRGVRSGAEGASSMTKEQCENLKALGYLPSSVPCPAS